MVVVMMQVAQTYIPKLLFAQESESEPAELQQKASARSQGGEDDTLVTKKETGHSSTAQGTETQWRI